MVEPPHGTENTFKDSEKKEREGGMGRNELRDRDGKRERQIGRAHV